MRRAAMIVAILGFAAIPALAATEKLPQQRPLIVSSHDHSLVEADDCDHFLTHNVTSFPSQARGQEQRDVALTGVDMLKIRTSEEGGISIRGWDRPTARLTVCKYAVALNDAQARRALGDVSVSIRSGTIIANGPEINGQQVWWVHMILRVPKAANLDVESENGGIAIRNMSGHVKAKATNGGISLASCAGENRIETENGGISLDLISGQLDATTRNGAISLHVRDVAIPSLEATTDGDGEIFCRLRACSGPGSSLKRTHLRLGSAPPTIRLSTTRAPIMIEQVR